jgi:hypothetical protein
MSAYAAAAAAVRTALEHLRGADTQGKDATLTAAISDLERVATLLEGRATAPKDKPAATPVAEPAAPPPAKKPAAKPPAAKRGKAAAPPPAKPAPDAYAGLAGHRKLREDVKAAEGLAILPKGDKDSLLARLEKAKDGTADRPPTVPGLFVADGRGGYRPATESEVWQALDAMSGKKVA